MVTSDLVRLYADSDALGLAELVRTRQVSSLELTETAISLIDGLDQKLNSVAIRTFDLAREMASGPLPAPSAACRSSSRTSARCGRERRSRTASAICADFVCDTDSEMARRIKAAGFVLLGRSNTPECGWCIATEPRLYGPTLNPWNEAITPGGSSGGAAAAGRFPPGAPRRGFGRRRLDPRSRIMLRPCRAQALARPHHLGPIPSSCGSARSPSSA